MINTAEMIFLRNIEEISMRYQIRKETATLKVELIRDEIFDGRGLNT